MSSASWAVTISGTVTNSSGKGGRIYLSVNGEGGWNTGSGVSLPTTATSINFEINGVQPNNTYIVKAFMDTQGTNVQHANDPSGVSASLNVGTGDYPGVGITLTNPATESPVAPDFLVYQGNGSKIVLWDGVTTNDDLVIANKYTLSWSADGGATVAGSVDIPAGFNDFFTHKSTAYSHYRVTAVNAAGSATNGWQPVTAISGSGSVTGKIYFTGGTPAGTLYVLIYDDSGTVPKIKCTAITSPVSGGSYTISNVPAGNYTVFAFVDMNGNGSPDIGDVGWVDNDDFNPRFTVGTTAVTAGDLTLNNVDSAISLGTNHGKNDWAEWYNIDVTVQSLKKRVVNVEILTGPQFASAVDVALEDWQEFNSWVGVPARPTVGDTYQIKVTYSDATTETVSKAVTGVLDGLPTPVAPIGNIPYSTTPPTFSWTAPAPAPTGAYIYSLWMNENYGGWMWDAWAIPSSTTSLAYGSMGDVSDTALTNGSAYNWSIEARDINYNKSSTQVSFTYSTAPSITSFTPTFGQAGTVVTISGTNLSTTNSVLFNGVTATVNASTTTSLTVTVPPGATSGRIQVTTSQGTVQSSRDFTTGTPAIIQGYVKTSGDAAAVAGARVEKSDDPTVYVTTAADGSFSLNWFQDKNITLKISKTGYVTTYTNDFWLSGNLDLRPYPSHLYTQAQLTAWGITAGKGVIVGRAMNNGTTPNTPVGGVVVTAQNQQSSNFYTVTYFDGTSFGGSATFSNGLFFVKNVDPSQWISVNASKTSWTFYNSSLYTYANSVTEGGVFGFTSPPYINSISPTTGKAGTSVTISGSSFSSTPAENTVTFNGTPATVTSASATTLTVTVPIAATTGQISVTTEGGSNSYWQTFTMLNTLTAAVSGSIGGTITSAPAGISCTNANSATTGCYADYDQGTAIDLTATVSDGYRFNTWSGACSGTTPTCSLTLTANKSVTATFEKLLYIKNGANYYSLLQEAFDAATNGSTIQAQARNFTDTDLIFNESASQVKFIGGYDNSFYTNSGYTILDGKLSIKSGTLRVEKLKVK